MVRGLNGTKEVEVHFVPYLKDNVSVTFHALNAIKKGLIKRIKA